LLILNEIIEPCGTELIKFIASKSVFIAFLFIKISVLTALFKFAAAATFNNGTIYDVSGALNSSGSFPVNIEITFCVFINCSN